MRVCRPVDTHRILFMVLKNQIQLSKSEDLFGCIQQFMNQAASHLANRKERQELPWRSSG